MPNRSRVESRSIPLGWVRGSKVNTDSTKYDNEGNELVEICGPSGIFIPKAISDRIDKEYEDWLKHHDEAGHLLDLTK